MSLSTLLLRVLGHSLEAHAENFVSNHLRTFRSVDTQKTFVLKFHLSCCFIELIFLDIY